MVGHVGVGSIRSCCGPSFPGYASHLRCVLVECIGPGSVGGKMFRQRRPHSFKTTTPADVEGSSVGMMSTFLIKPRRFLRSPGVSAHHSDRISGSSTSFSHVHSVSVPPRGDAAQHCTNNASAGESRAATGNWLRGQESVPTLGVSVRRRCRPKRVPAWSGVASEGPACKFPARRSEASRLYS